MKILVAGYQHETNTFAPTQADWAAFNRGDSFPAFVHGLAMLDRLRGVNIPIGGFIDAARSFGWQLLPSSWCGAIPSAHVTEDAFERISASIMADVTLGGFDAVYLDLHGAAVAEHVDDTEGELIARIRRAVGGDVPIVASLDLHANVTLRMLAEADALVSYRSYPHVDMAATGELAAQLLARRVKLGRREATAHRRLPFLIPLNAQSTWMEPARSLYEELVQLDRDFGTMSSFCIGFPAADFDECAPMVWSHGARAAAALQRLYERVAEPTQWRADFLDAPEAVCEAMGLAARSSAPVVLADTQDNPGAGGDSNTTGLLHALLQQHAGRAFPGQVALGLLCDPQAAERASWNSAVSDTVSREELPHAITLVAMAFNGARCRPGAGRRGVCVARQRRGVRACLAQRAGHDAYHTPPSAQAAPQRQAAGRAAPRAVMGARQQDRGAVAAGSADPVGAGREQRPRGGVRWHGCAGGDRPA